jgi:MFS transporter, DHA3 family, macrolide efflux protein
VSATVPATSLPPSQSLRPFLIIWSGQICSWFGSELVQFALVWWLTKTTGSATVLTLATTLAVLPRIFIGPFAGVLVDRWNRRVVMLVADATIALATIGLAMLYSLSVVQIWHIYALMFIRATGGVFHLPAMTASTTLLVPEKHLSRVAGLNQTFAGIVAIVSPPLGALLLELIPMQGVLAIDVITAIFAIGPLLFVPIPQPAHPEIPTSTPGKISFVSSVLSDLRTGLRFAWNFAGLRILIGIIMLLNVLGWPLVTLVPILVTKHFGGGAIEFSWFQSALGVGAILGGFVLGVWGGFQRRIITMLLALILDGICMIALGFSPTSALFLAAGAWFLVGVMSSTINATSLAILQATVPPAVQGRVFALQWSLVTAMSPLGLVIAGPVADVIGAPIWYVIAGLAHAVVGVVALFIPALMRIEETAVEHVTAMPPNNRI